MTRPMNAFALAIASGPLRLRCALSALAALSLFNACHPALAQTRLADAPIFAVSQVPGNLALVLSVEFPTAISVAHTDRVYNPNGDDYLGYFDPGKCYDYRSSSADTTTTPGATPDSYFFPRGLTSPAGSHLCSGLWSGNFLNWATMQTIDPFRWVLTGGYRVVDTPSLTVLEKAWAPANQGSSSNFPDSSIDSSTLAGATPFGSVASAMTMRIFQNGNKMRFSVGQQLPMVGNYYNNKTLSDPVVLSRTDYGTAMIRNNTAPGPRVNTYNYSVRWTANVSAPAAGAYTFQTVSDDGVRLYINNTRVIDNFTDHGPSTDTSTSITLNQGDPIAIVLEYYQAGGGAVIDLKWKPPGATSYTAIGGSPADLYSATPQPYDPASPTTSTAYEVFVRAKVCDASAAAGGLEDNCIQYGSRNWKPQGLMQQYSNKIRYSAFGYLNDSDLGRDGGVLRARQKFIGPTEPVPGSPAVVNVAGAVAGQTTASEWDATTGVFVANPDASDASAATTQFGPSISNSGVMNYVNKFGEITRNGYKTYDPVGELYYAATRYFKHLGNVPEWSNANSSSAAAFLDGFPVITAWDDPILYSCQRNFALGIGDVNTHADKNVPGNTNSSNEPAMPLLVATDTSVNAVTATNTVGQLEGLPAGLGLVSPYGGCCNNNSALMAGLAYDAHVRDLRPNDFPRADGGAKQRPDFSTLSTYWVDVQENQQYKTNNQFYLAAKYGGFVLPSTYNYGDPIGTATSTTSWHNNTDSLNGQLRPDNYFSGGRPDLMRSGLQTAFADIASRLAAPTTAFSTPLGQVGNGGNGSFTSSFDASNWTGEVTANALSFDANFVPTSTPVWTLASLLTTQLGTNQGWDLNRRVITWNTGASPQTAIPFRSGSLSAAQLNALSRNDSANYLNYLRGDPSNEQATGGSRAYRNRTKLLGDIVDSKLRVVGAPAFPYLDASNPGYAAFKAAYVNRPTVVYFGANDGMLHAVNGDLASATTTPSGLGGTELFAYVPGALYSGPNGTPATDGLASLGKLAFVHHHFVDATPAQYDVDFSRTANAPASGPDWHSILIGGLGKGGKSYYAIDVTDSAAMVAAAAAQTSTAAATAVEAAFAGKVLWEFSASPSVPLGFSYGDPVVVKTKKYGWVVVIPSGYNPVDGVGRLFLLNPKTGALLETLSTGVGAPGNDAGLAQLNGFINDSTDGTVDSLYAGDLLGNLWRFDMTALAGSGAYPSPIRIASLTDSSGVAQPVTTSPTIAVDPTTKKRFVLVGTGRLLDTTDIQATQQQTFYAIVDGTDARFGTAATLPRLPSPATYPLTRSNLFQNLSSVDTVTFDPTRQAGWYEDLGSNGGTRSELGWRMVSDSSTLSGAVGFSTIRPDISNVCSPSGTSRVYGRAFGNTSSVITTTTQNGNVLLEPYLQVGGTVTDTRFLSVAGRGGLYYGVGGAPVKAETTSLPGQTLRRLNWRELPIVE